jgi:hypothetical protein
MVEILEFAPEKRMRGPICQAVCLAARLAAVPQQNCRAYCRNAVPAEDLPRLAKRALADFSLSDYDHAAWFFGAGPLPRWAGYSLGFRIVGDHVAAICGSSAHSLASAAAADFHHELQQLALRDIASV